MKATYITPALLKVELQGDPLLFNPASNPNLPSTPEQPTVGVKENDLFDTSDLWGSEFE